MIDFVLNKILPWVFAATGELFIYAGYSAVSLIAFLYFSGHTPDNPAYPSTLTVIALQIPAVFLMLVTVACISHTWKKDPLFKIGDGE